MKTFTLKLFPLLFLFLTACTTYIPPNFDSPPTPQWPTPPQSHYKQSKEVIVVDAGHGGEDFGAHSTTSPIYQEKSLNLSTAQMLKKYLEQYGYTVIMTRHDDTFISLERRAEIANLKKPTLFVSVHYNSAPSKEAQGIEVYYYKKEGTERSIQSQMLAKSILDRVIKNTQAKSRGVKHGDFAVIRNTNMPAVLVEGGFLTNANEMQKIKDANYLKSLALGIAQGIKDYVLN